MELLYGLTEQQMKKVHQEVERDYCKEDILLKVQDMNEDREIKIELSEAELQKAVDDMVETIEQCVSYSQYATDVINDILETRV